jgi:TfoX/Sxy family transcriptional regulator of competence genes
MTGAEESFASIAARLLPEPGVTEGTGFGANAGLRVGGRIFAMLVRGELVVKLPAERCAELVAAGAARPFDRGQGRPLREWVSVADASSRDWPELAHEALAFVRR